MDLDPYVPPGEINITDEDVKVEVVKGRKGRNSTGINSTKDNQGDCENNANG